MKWLVAQFEPYLPGQTLEVGIGHGSYCPLLGPRCPNLLARRPIGIIMDLAGRISVKLLNRWNGHPKALLRAFARRLGVPPGVVDGRKKGFNVPIARMLRRELAPLGDHLLTHDADLLAPYLNPDAVRGLWRAHRDGKANHAFALWPLLVLAVWRAGLGASDSAPGTVGAARAVA